MSDKEISDILQSMIPTKDDLIEAAKKLIAEQQAKLEAQAAELARLHEDLAKKIAACQKLSGILVARDAELARLQADNAKLVLVKILVPTDYVELRAELARVKQLADDRFECMLKDDEQIKELEQQVAQVQEELRVIHRQPM